MNETDKERLRRLRDEATGRFVGQGSVAGVAVGGDDALTVMFSRPDARQEEAVRAWGRDRAVTIDVLVTGSFTRSASALP